MKKYGYDDFAHLAYSPFGEMEVKGGSAPESGSYVANLFRRYPDLGGLESWRAEWDLEANEYKVMRYVMLLYQVGSPLLGVQNLAERKVIAARLAGFDMDGSDYWEPYKRVMVGEEILVNERILDFCRLQKNPDFAEYVVYEETFYKQLKMSTREDDPGNVRKIMDNIGNLKVKLTALRKSFMFDDNSRAMLDAFLERVNLEVVKLRREHIAEGLLGGEKLVDDGNPYGGWSKQYVLDVNEAKYHEQG